MFTMQYKHLLLQSIFSNEQIGNELFLSDVVRDIVDNLLNFCLHLEFLSCIPPPLCNPTNKNQIERDMDFLEAIHEVRVVLANHALTVRCGMMAARIIGPYLLRDTMNAECYLEMLENYVWPKVAVWENINDLIFVQDGVPPHFALTIRARLDQHFSGRWLGRRRSHEWPPKSPYLTLIDFYLWGHTKEEV